jgi:hypothetical protein
LALPCTHQHFSTPSRSITHLTDSAVLDWLAFRLSALMAMTTQCGLHRVIAGT